MKAEVVADTRGELSRALEMAGPSFYRWDRGEASGISGLTFYTDFQSAPDEAICFPFAISARMLADIIADSMRRGRFQEEDARAYKVTVAHRAVRVDYVGDGK